MFAFLNNCHEGADHRLHAEAASASGKRPRAIIRRIEDGLRADESRLARADGRVGSEASATTSPSGRSSARETDASGGQKHYAAGRRLDPGRRLRADVHHDRIHGRRRSCRRSRPCGWSC